MAPRVTMTTRDHMALVVAEVLKVPPVGDTVVQAAEGDQGLLVETQAEEGVTTATDVAMTAINLVELHLPVTMTATPRAERVSEMAAVQGGTILGPAVTPHLRGPAVATHPLVPPKVPHMEVVPLGSTNLPILLPVEAMVEAPITTVVVVPVVAPASPDQSLPVTTVMDHRLVEVALVVGAAFLTAVVHHQIVEATQERTAPLLLIPAVEVHMTSCLATAGDPVLVTEVPKQARVVLDRPLPVVVLQVVHIPLGVLLPLPPQGEISQPPQRAAMALEVVEPVEVLAQLAQHVGDHLDIEKSNAWTRRHIYMYIMLGII